MRGGSLFIHHSSLRIHHFLFIPHPSALIPYLKHPRVAARVVGERAVGVPGAELFVAGEQALVAALGGVNRAVRNLLEVALDLPNVLRREAPVVASEFVEVGDAVAGDACRQVNVGVEVAPREQSQIAEDGAATVKAEVARAGDRTPQAAALKNEDEG